MEAMTLGYPAEDKGKICVTASKEEWLGVVSDLNDLLVAYADLEISSDVLIDLLRDLGVDL